MVAVLPHPAKYVLTDGVNRKPETETALEVDSSGVQASILKQSWPYKSGQQDKWSFCLRAVKMAAAQERR